MTAATFDDALACADALIECCGGRVRIALPLGLGKPVRLVDALYRRARERPQIELEISTALDLDVPRPRSALEARFLNPLVERLYAGVPVPAYLADLSRGTLPANVRISEFYLRPGAFLGVPGVQQRYVASDYAHAARDLVHRGLDVVAQQVAPGAEGGYSLACNPDLTLDLMSAADRAGLPRPLLIGEVNAELPWFGGDAVLPASAFHALLESPETRYPLFPLPNRAVGLTEHVIGLRVAGLVRDGGTLQVGIGGIGDAVTSAIALRRRDNARFRALARALDMGPEAELDALPEGLYGASEMFVEGFLHLHDAGVLCRTVDDGVFLHAGFWLGSAAFYERLRALDPATRRGIAMTRISFTNRLLGDEVRKRAQRVHARFVNMTMMVTLLGAAVSDALENGRVVSGVGGQSDFVMMAHELDGARAILVLPATRTVRGRVTSNIVWNYGHVTVPRHLRDVVVTEYGVADLRGASDQDVIAALLAIADSHFQERLRRAAVKAGKLPRDYRIPARFRRNTPERLHAALRGDGLLDALPWYPLGTDLTDVEAELAVALAALERVQRDLPAVVTKLRTGIRHASGDGLQPALARMGLDAPSGLRARFQRALLAGALVERAGGGRPLLP